MLRILFGFFFLCANAFAGNSYDSYSDLWTQAQAQGAPMVALKKAFELSQSNKFSRRDVFGLFDISQPSANKRFYVIDLRAHKIISHYVAHGKSNGDNFKATRFRGFQSDHSMTPLGPLRTAARIEIMEHYRDITDRSTGKVYSELGTLWLEGITSYNQYINNATDPATGGRAVWIMHPAWYVSKGFRGSMPGGLGRSLGCLAFDPAESNKIIAVLQGGALIYITVGDAPVEKFL
ncbi:MAG: murein L,D-transpeptidase catalytic domain-containing protein [Bdellovibrionota bacterium]